MQTQNAELHRLRWENRSRSDEISDLQKALQDAKLYLYDEREQVLKLQAENDNLKQQEIEDRRRIQQLLALTQPLTEEVSDLNEFCFVDFMRLLYHAWLQYTFFRDARPVSTKAATGQIGAAQEPPAGRNGFPIRPHTDSAQNAGSGTAPSSAGVKVTPTATSAGLGATRAIRTVESHDGALLSTPSGAVAASHIDSLKKQVEDLRRLMDERTAAFARDRQALLATSSRRADTDAATIRALEGQLAGVQTKLTGLTKGE